MDAENTYQVFSWLWTSGQLTERDINTLPQLGVRTVINLLPSASSNALRGEADLVTQSGISYLQIPVKWDQPTLEQFFQFSVVIKGHQGRPCWVHCANNLRASTFIYLYRRLYMGDDEVVAGDPMHELWEPNAVWQSFISNALRFVNSQKKITDTGTHVRL